ncbi:replication-relaxation family protein [Streptomyces galilaeus]|uniref:Replication-relaxation family protein n=1 Tax=Streptomyces galilaeus TaxID=33899 RepID=A0ABW9ITJ8_STRGJ
MPDALLYYRRGPVDGDNGSMLRAFVEVDRATMGPERLAAKLTAYERLYRYVPVARGASRPCRNRRLRIGGGRYPLFPRVLFVLDSTGPAGVENRISALRAGAGLLARFPYDVPVLVALLADLLQHGPSAPVWRPVHDLGQRVRWTESGRWHT